jgi:hypothetical protein
MAVLLPVEISTEAVDKLVDSAPFRAAVTMQSGDAVSQSILQETAQETKREHGTSSRSFTSLAAAGRGRE